MGKTTPPQKYAVKEQELQECIAMFERRAVILMAISSADIDKHGSPSMFGAAHASWAAATHGYSGMCCLFHCRMDLQIYASLPPDSLIMAQR